MQNFKFGKSLMRYFFSWRWNCD